MGRWGSNPALFSREVLGVEPWRGQEEILGAVASHLRVSVRSGHKVGKSTTLAILALWFLATRWRARVVMTSASGRQVETVLWKELKRLYKAAPVPLGGTLHEKPSSGLQLSDGREILGFSTNEPERMAGVSSPNLLYLVDEASGVNEQLFEAIEGNRAGGASIVLCSNPTRLSGTFYESQTTKRNFWHPIHLSSEETPNATGRGTPVPGLAGAAWVAEKKLEWGEDSPLYQVRVRGNFPREAANAVVALHLVEAGVDRYEEAFEELAQLYAAAAELPRFEVGVDVAWTGDDDSVITPIRGLVALPATAVKKRDPVDVAGEVLRIVRERKGKDLDRQKPRVKVDVIGIGAGVVALLARHRDELEVVPVNVAESATAEGYHRLRDQLWCGLADWLKEGGALAPDDTRDAELVAPTYGFDVQGRQEVEAKPEIKKRLHRSPDRAESLMLAIYKPPSAGRPVSAGRREDLPRHTRTRGTPPM